MRLTKTLIAAAVATAFAGSAMAGGFAAEIIEPPVVVVEEAAGSSYGWILPVVALAALAALAYTQLNEDE
ncbi:hypothetical protein JQU17_14835 [Ponticoccus sp. SC2-23]|uniref:hypothetical protein n=1 Tax=Alexandriicola marinus TaxID=2081710 RepID=UPI000FDB52B5|nr:hypothetical protein [Alexandriicola marinus]MBM1221852.1 hypothetical protein [Ponticoccus sp. SC6-9]MBM1226203.1 hypothetical protein [Ponticoccus sp. SC6-15]MBM1230799.1 hypothetical protein [Ponticoccus sp. SC6-38]MBM1235360.1 hypothetical protein [Ponticoccus sp. SC6-45]MBM1239821.1 hypothetical protein [Ponticoccus sp. SC6-49]MBM1243965.1 hypothetical protein [Ponticoccus sp. SC2-64]MBM1248884.1 hypothetical protein [Ponticoccus sp. SC6-42]MBM1253476.1 hypothetical protein [Pontico